MAVLFSCSRDRCRLGQNVHVSLVHVSSRVEQIVLHSRNYFYTQMGNTCILKIGATFKEKKRQVISFKNSPMVKKQNVLY